MKNIKNKKKEIIILLVLLFVVGGGIFIYINKDKDIKPVKKIVKVKVEKKLKILDLESQTRPYGVMINNIGDARNIQSGLSEAYLIYEIIVEGGLTRYFALFVDKDVERIGSIRSARHYFLDYALENDAFYVHHGQSPQALREFSYLGIDRIVVDNQKTGFRDRSLDKSSEHTLFTSTSLLENGIGRKRTEKNKELLFNYSIESLKLSEDENALTANKIIVPYSNNVKNEYTYDEETKLYSRAVNGTSQKDYSTGEDLYFKNIITYNLENYNLDKYGRQDIKNVGSGDGYYITEGKAVKIKWEKKSRSSQTIYTYKDEKLTLNDGNTFVQIMPTTKNVSIIE